METVKDGFHLLRYLWYLKNIHSRKLLLKLFKALAIFYKVADNYISCSTLPFQDRSSCLRYFGLRYFGFLRYFDNDLNKEAAEGTTLTWHAVPV